ncbi:hypothetical protein V496_07524, partial [Pseudogymnoascus sp. VKM F-4515 (FW-2607)]
MSDKANPSSDSTAASGSTSSKSFTPYTITSSGTNSQGNHHDSRIQPAGPAYHYSNSNGSYYYANGDKSTYYNDGQGGATLVHALGDEVALAQGEAAAHGGAGARCPLGVERVDVEGEVDGGVGADVGECHFHDLADAVSVGAGLLAGEFLSK